MRTILVSDQMLSQIVHDLRCLDFDDFYIIHAISNNLKRAQISKILQREKSCIRKKIRRIAAIFGDEYFTKDKRGAYVLSDKGRGLALIVDSFMLGIINERRLKTTQNQK